MNVASATQADEEIGDLYLFWSIIESVPKNERAIFGQMSQVIAYIPPGEESRFRRILDDLAEDLLERLWNDDAYQGIDRLCWGRSPNLGELTYCARRAVLMGEGNYQAVQSCPTKMFEGGHALGDLGLASEHDEKAWDEVQSGAYLIHPMLERLLNELGVCSHDMMNLVKARAIGEVETLME